MFVRFVSLLFYDLMVSFEALLSIIHAFFGFLIFSKNVWFCQKKSNNKKIKLEFVSCVPLKKKRLLFWERRWLGPSASSGENLCGGLRQIFPLLPLLCWAFTFFLFDFISPTLLHMYYLFRVAICSFTNEPAQTASQFQNNSWLFAAQSRLLLFSFN